jgi:hypothetical protein
MKSILNLASVVALTFSIVACKASSDLKNVPNEGKTEAVGPFDLKLSSATNEVANAFSIRVAQDEGAVEFYVNAEPNVQYLHLDKFSTQVSGCDPNKVKVVHGWFTTEGASSGEVVQSGWTMTTTTRNRAKLVVAFKGLDGCSQLNYSMVARKLDVGPIEASLDSRFQGNWLYTAGTHEINMFVGTTRVGWLEGKGTTYTCDLNLYPQNSLTPGGGWLVFSGGRMICEYGFTNTNSLNINCFGQHSYNCTVPKNLSFSKR